MSQDKQITYRDAGVDIDAGNELVRRISSAAKATRRPEMLSGLGGFAALTALPKGYDEPILVTGTDGVGTKLRLAIDHGQHGGIGQDLVAMCVNDVLVTGAEPFLFLDYYATGALDVDVAETVIKSIASACQLSGCALAGGETAEMPGHYAAGDYDLAGFCVAVVDRADIIDGSRISAGDRLIGLPSSGPHSNGYSLIRKIIERQGTPLPAERIDALLTPTRIYAKSILQVIRGPERLPVHGMVHITGGGFWENIPRMLPDDTLTAQIDADAWQWPELFSWLQQAGNVAEHEMLRTFNCGIGMLLCVPEHAVDAVVARLREAGEQPLMLGAMVPRASDGDAVEIR
ncbi:MAG: phosphoribosylformylglycinamidine cyclo-ligase [Pseudomonadales bacterium]